MDEILSAFNILFDNNIEPSLYEKMYYERIYNNKIKDLLNKDTYTTDEVLEILEKFDFKIAKRTIRHYENIGLIPQNKQQGKRGKKYDEKTIKCLLQLAIDLKKRGKTNKEIIENLNKII